MNIQRRLLWGFRFILFCISYYATISIQYNQENHPSALPLNWFKWSVSWQLIVFEITELRGEVRRGSFIINLPSSHSRGETIVQILFNHSVTSRPDQLIVNVPNLLGFRSLWGSADPACVRSIIDLSCRSEMCNLILYTWNAISKGMYKICKKEKIIESCIGWFYC